jgi:hypothetical protein
MENHTALIETLFEKTGRYTKTNAELFKLKAIDKFADIVSTLTARLAVVVLMTLFFLILNIGIGLWLGELTGKVYYGFFIVSGFYAIVGFVLYIFRNKWVRDPLRNSIITQALN